MSLNSLKETLRSCRSKPPLTSSFSSSQISSISHDLDSRKPPKTSISEQLLRLQGPSQTQEKEPIKDAPLGYLPQTRAKSPRKETIMGLEVEDEGEKRNGFLRPKPETFQFDHTGPYEPLVLSLPDEFPVIQVISNCLIINFGIFLNLFDICGNNI